MAHPEQPDGDAYVTPQAEANASGRRPLRDRIRNASAEAGVVQQVVERDDAIGYLLAGIAAQPDLAGSLIFKGGTALKKLYFGDYRFSEDLDFSILAGPRAEAREAALQRAVEEAERQLRTHDPFDLEIVRYVERLPHPGGQEAFVIRIQFPWHPQPLCRIKIEITDDEPVLLPPERRDLIPEALGGRARAGATGGGCVAARSRRASGKGSLDETADDPQRVADDRAPGRDGVGWGRGAGGAAAALLGGAVSGRAG